MDWEQLSYRIQIKRARIVALVDGGGAVVETGDIEYREGRQLVFEGSDDRDGMIDVLRFTAGFGPVAAADPESSASVESQIVISGVGPNGPVEIRGPGFFGYDDNGHFEGWFDDPPTILVGERHPPRPAADLNAQTRALEEKFVPPPDPKPSPQYLKALIGRPIEPD